MDKLKALHYFLASAQAGSLSAAARQLGVSLQAVAKLVGALEAQLGVALLKRGSRGLTLTSDGAQYADACAPLLAQLQAIDDGLRQSRQRPQGTLVVGGTPFFMQHCIVPALSAFHDAYPDLALDLRHVVHLDEAAARDCDLLVLHGWFEAGHFVRRELPVIPQVTVASPGYWKRHGLPRHPRELANHTCLCYRNPYGKLLDLWRYRQASDQGETIEQVIVRGWLHSNHRDNLLELALGGGRRDATCPCHGPRGRGKWALSTGAARLGAYGPSAAGDLLPTRTASNTPRARLYGFRHRLLRRARAVDHCIGTFQS